METQGSLFTEEESSQEEVVLDPSRTARQLEAVDKWQANNGKGTFMATTGYGKTRCALLAAQRLCNSPNAKGQRDVTVIAPSHEIRRAWEEKKKEVDFPLEVFTIQSFVKEYSVTNKRKTSLLIADEMHRYFSEVHGTLFSIVDYDFILGLTATIDPEEEKYQTLPQIAPIIDKVPLEEALENGWVSPYYIFNLGIDLDEEGLETYRGIQRRYNNYFKTFDFDYGLAMDCIQTRHVRESHARRIGWDEGAVMTHAVQLSRTVQERKKFLYNYPKKLTLAKQIIDRFSDDIFITFSESTDFADKLEELLGDIAVAYHSNLPTLITDQHTKEVIARGVEVKGKTRYKDAEGATYTWAEIKKAYPKRKLKRKGTRTRRKEALKRFAKDKECRAITTGKALDEGFNVPAITAAIVASGHSKTRQSIQRLGRTIRQVKGKTAFQVELYVKNTQEETWLRNRQEEFEFVTWINSIDEIIILNNDT